MSKLIEMPTAEGTLIVEVAATEGEIILVDKTGQRIIEKLDKAFELAEGAIVNSCTVLTGILKQLAQKEPALESASLECGFQFSGEGNVYLVKTAAEGSIKVTMNLKLRE